MEDGKFNRRGKRAVLLLPEICKYRGSHPEQ